MEDDHDFMRGALWALAFCLPLWVTVILLWPFA